MNPLAHAYFVLEAYKNEKLTKDQRDHLIVGSIIPDISQFGLANYRQTHTRGGAFLKQAKNPLERYFALGLISHGERPAGLDFHSHKKKGYIDSKQRKVIRVLQKYKKHIGKINHGLTHDIIEFAVDYLIAKRDPTIIKKVRVAFMNPKITETTTHFLRFLNIPRRRTKRINKYIQNKHLQHFFQNFDSLGGMADNWRNIKFFHNLKGGRHLPLREKIKRLTELSYYNLKRKIKNKKIMNMFEETSTYLEKDYHRFLSQSQRKFSKLKNEFLRNINSKKV
ncbi:hypothetical protein GOV03_01055 [Candidatus Woesearchaeota archaeon]|nr:hypothetical protein [Candidatus Woesearchaeota archaeon]